MTLRSQTVLAGIAVAAGALIIGCGGSGDNGFNGTNGTLTTGTNTNGTATGTNTGTATGTTGTATGVPTTPGVLPANTILFTVNDGDNGFLRQVKPDGTGGSVVSTYSPNVIAIAPSPVATDQYAFVGRTMSSGSYRIYRGTSAADPTSSTAIATTAYAVVTDLAFAPDGKTVFFVGAVNEGDPTRLYSVPFAGGAVATLDSATRISVSPVGTRIAYSKENADASGTDVYVRDYAAGSTPVRVTTAVAENSYPAFNRAGTKLVYSSNASGTYELYTANPDGTGIAQITTTPTLDEFAAAYNDDGTKIAYSAQSSELGGSGIYTANADGSARSQLVSDSSIDFDVYWTSLLGRSSRIPVLEGFMLRRPIAPKR